MHNSQTAIQVQNLKKKFKEKEVLRGVTFRIDKGTVFCLLGSNGAGKTTTIKNKTKSRELNNIIFSYKNNLHYLL